MSSSDWRRLVRWAKANDLVITRAGSGYLMAGESFADVAEVEDWFAEHRPVWYWRRSVRNLKGIASMSETSLVMLRRTAELPGADETLFGPEMKTIAEEIAEVEAMRELAWTMLAAAYLMLNEAERAAEA